MRFSDMSAQQQDFLARYLGLQPPPDATAPPEDPTGAPARDQFRIFVRDGDGKTVALDVRPDMPVADLLPVFLARAGYRPDEDGYLATGTKPLSDRGTVGDYGISRDATLQFTLRLRGGDSTRIGDKTLGKVHDLSQQAAEHPRYRQDGVRRRDAQDTPITQGEAKWKLSRADAIAGLKARKLAGGHLDEALAEMGYVNGITVVRVPPLNDMEKVREDASLDFDDAKRREFYHAFKKDRDDGKDHHGLSNAELEEMAAREFDTWLATARGAEGQKSKAVAAEVAQARKDKEWLTDSIKAGSADKRTLIKGLDRMLKTNPGMLIQMCERRVPVLPPDAGYQQNCVSDVLPMDDGFPRFLMETIIEDAQLRPSVTHGNGEKKLPTKQDPYSSAPDNDLYAEYGVGAGGGLRLVQNLETGDIYLSAHYAHFYLIEQNGTQPEAALVRLAEQRRKILEFQAQTVAAEFGCTMRHMQIVLPDGQQANVPSFCRTAIRGMSKKVQAMLALENGVQGGNPHDDPGVQAALRELSQKFDRLIRPIVEQKAYLLEAEDQADRDRLERVMDEYHQRLGPRIAAL